MKRTLKMKQAHATLVCWIKQGVEYPEAHWRVCHQYGLTVAQGDEVQRMYDEVQS